MDPYTSGWVATMHTCRKTVRFRLAVTIGDASFSAEGDPELVQRMFGEFKELAIGSTRPSRHRKPPPEEDGKAGGGQKPDDTKTRADELPLPAFLDTLKMRGNKEIGTAILSWSARHGGKDTLTPHDIEALWKDTKHKPPIRKNLTRDLKSAVKEGWIRSHGSGAGIKFQALGFTHSTVDGWKRHKDG